MPKRIVLFALLCILVLSLFPNVAGSAQNSSPDNPTACEFQPMAVTRTPTVDNIRQLGSGGSNISPDNTFIGLHRWNDKQWPAVDYLVETTLPFKSGGVVAWLGTDGAGGGNSIIIDGTGDCQGWRTFFGHLNYDPATKFVVGQRVSSEEVIGVPGCSGFTCSDTLPPHNHVTLGYKDNVFNFADGTPAYKAGNVRTGIYFYWIHPARVEGVVSIAPSQPTVAPTTEEIESEARYSFSTNAPPAYSEKINLLDSILGIINDYQIIFYVVLGFLVIFLLGGLFSGKTDSVGTTVILATILAVLAVIYFVGIDRVIYRVGSLFPQSSKYSFYIPNGGGASYVFSTTHGDESDEPTSETTPVPAVYITEDGKPSRNPADYPLNVSTLCEVSPKFSQAVLQWCGLITHYSNQKGLDPNYVAAVITWESHGDPEACTLQQVVNGIPICGSTAGAIGLMQVMASDGLSGEKYPSVFWDRPTALELLNPDICINEGTDILVDYGALYNKRAALVSYHGADTLGYADGIMQIYYNNQP